MSKAILMLLLAMVSSNAMARWVEITEGEKMTVSFDPATVRKNGNLVKVWHLYDFKAPYQIDGKAYLSIKVLTEYDCKEERSRLLSRIGFSGNTGTGGVIQNEDAVDRWRPISPDSIDNTLWKSACKRK